LSIAGFTLPDDVHFLQERQIAGLFKIAAEGWVTGRFSIAWMHSGLGSALALES
jgi:hypothetical protein